MRRMVENQHAVQYGYRLLHPIKPIQNQADFMSEKTVFISYSHDTDEHREKVLALSERLRDDGIHTLLDQYINGSPKQGWPRWMLDQLDAADYVLVVCTETYYRRFRGHEKPGIGKGVDWEGTLITQEIYDQRSQTLKFVPIFLGSVNPSYIPEPLRSISYYALTSEDAYQNLYDFLLDQAGVEARPVGTLKTKPRRTAKSLQFGKPAAETTTAKPVPNDITRIIEYAPENLIGRESDLKLITQAWQQVQTQSRNRPHILTFVALGGEGKTSLVAHWLIENLVKQDWQGCDVAFAWSFYSQGTREQVAASSDLFLSEALTFFGDEATANSAKSAHDKGKRLAQLVGGQRSVLVLDGLEPLQYPPTSPTPGELKDDGIKALLKTLASQNHGLCLVTTRYAIPDLKAFRTSTAPMHDLLSLSPAAGVHLLKQLGVHGAQKEFEKLVEDVQGHALSLNLLGSYLKDAHGGDIRKRDLINFAEANAEEHNGHAFHIMDAYLAWLEQGSAGVPPASNPNQPLAERSRSQQSQSQQLAPALLKLLGLFDRPATADCLAALWQAPPIKGLTEALFTVEKQWLGFKRNYRPVDRDQINISLSRLEAAKLLTVTRDASGTLLALDSHPLIREYFAKYLKERQPLAFQAAHQRLYQHLCESTPHQPDSLEGLQPLYQAVAHGCLAGLQQEVCDKVYRDRILRGTSHDGFYSTKKLGIFGADLSAVACFFDTPWQRVSSALIAAYQAWLLNAAAIRLRALGRLTEALEPMRVSGEIDAKAENWKGAAISYSNLSELELTLGDIILAVADAEQSVRHADASGDAFHRMSKRTTYADALHQAGRRAEAAAAFREAEALQAESQPDYPLLYSLFGFRYCDLLLSDLGLLPLLAGQNSNVEDPTTVLAEVMARATQAIKIAERNKWILDIALDHLTLGRAHLYGFIIAYPAIPAAHDTHAAPHAQSTAQAQELNTAASELAAAVDGLRRSGRGDILPRGLLTRAWLRRLTSQLGYAEEGVDGVVGYAVRTLPDAGLDKVHTAYPTDDDCMDAEGTTPGMGEVDRVGNKRSGATQGAVADDCMDAGGTTPRMGEVDRVGNKRSGAMQGAVVGEGSAATTQAAASDGLPSVSPSYIDGDDYSQNRATQGAIADDGYSGGRAGKMPALHVQACPAQADLDEAYDIAERGPMPLFLADIHLYRAGLFHNANPYPWQSPKHDLAEARRLIEKHGYWRRKAELEGLEQRLL